MTNKQPLKSVEEVVEQYAQAIQDMYFLAGAKISVETWNNTKDFLRNALHFYTAEREKEVMNKVRALAEECFENCEWAKCNYPVTFLDALSKLDVTTE